MILDARLIPGPEASLVWLWLVEDQTPDRWSTIGGAICLIGAAVILWGPGSA
ncbi:MAG: hypothetical protein IT445_10140 [Phycisphaeraceae bacterium]|nr:hypothetical protein [Phycisphaeraceae bacterium]